MTTTWTLRRCCRCCHVSPRTVTSTWANQAWTSLSLPTSWWTATKRYQSRALMHLNPSNTESGAGCNIKLCWVQIWRSKTPSDRREWRASGGSVMKVYHILLKGFKFYCNERFSYLNILMPELMFAANWFRDHSAPRFRRLENWTLIIYVGTRHEDGAGKLQLQRMGSHGKWERSHV